MRTPDVRVTMTRKMKSIGATVTVLAAALLSAAASGWDNLWGTWEGRNSSDKVVLTPTNITITTSGTQEVWDVKSGTGIITGMQVSRNGTNVAAQGSVKLNHMIFHIGERIMVLRKAGTEDMKFAPGKAPNRHERIDDPERDPSGEGTSHPHQVRRPLTVPPGP